MAPECPLAVAELRLVRPELREDLPTPRMHGGADARTEGLAPPSPRQLDRDCPGLLSGLTCR